MLTIVIQAGGESRRMGQDKARLNFRGQPLIGRVIARVARLADEILVTTNQPEAYNFLHVPCIPDLLPGRGALGGLFTALSAAQNPLVAVIACDMPFVSSELLAFQRDVLLATSADAAIPRMTEGLEPFHAIYRKATCLPLVQAALEKGQRRVDSWLAQADIRYLTPEEIAHYDPGGLAFLNINTPEDLVAAIEQGKTISLGNQFRGGSDPGA
jgi:molybdopterin-guanine dinucleotide biosynthesis protein A